MWDAGQGRLIVVDGPQFERLVISRLSGPRGPQRRAAPSWRGYQGLGWLPLEGGGQTKPPCFQCSDFRGFGEGKFEIPDHTGSWV